MAIRKIIVTLAVEVEYYYTDHKPSEVAEALKERLTAFLYPVGMKVAKADVGSIEHNS